MSKVAVWMPVYNEERHLRSALESVLAPMVSLYVALRGYNLRAVPGAVELFDGDVRTQQLLLAARHIDQQTRLLVDRQ